MAIKAYTAILQYGDTADYSTTTTWTSLAKVKSFKPPKVTAKDIDTTVLDTPDEFENSIAGLADSGKMSADIQYASAATATLYGFFRTLKAWRIVYADASGWKMNGYINEYGDEEIHNGEIVMTGLQSRVVGKPVPGTGLS